MINEAGLDIGDTVEILTHRYKGKHATVEAVARDSVDLRVPEISLNLPYFNHEVAKVETDLPREISFKEIKKGDRIRVSDSHGGVISTVEGIAQEHRRGMGVESWCTEEYVEFVYSNQKFGKYEKIELVDRPVLMPVPNYAAGTVLAIKVENTWVTYIKYSTVPHWRYVSPKNGLIIISDDEMVRSYINSTDWKLIYTPSHSLE